VVLEAQAAGLTGIVIWGLHRDTASPSATSPTKVASADDAGHPDPVPGKLGERDCAGSG